MNARVRPGGSITATSRPKWRHTWELLGHPGWMRNRGVAIKDGRLVRGTSDGYLIALNVADGSLLWAKRVAKSEDGETFSTAPVIYEDLILIGRAGSENNVQGWPPHRGPVELLDRFVRRLSTMVVFKLR